MKHLFTILFFFIIIQIYGQYNVYEVSRNGDLEQIELLYKSDNNCINKINENGYTPLILASYHGNEEIVSFLVKHVNDVNFAGDYGTALMAASFKGFDKIVNLLLQNDADTSIADESGVTSLHYAVMFNHTNIVKQMIEAGADSSIKDNKGYSALDYAKDSKNEELLTLLKQ
jgi:hypothetical protein